MREKRIRFGMREIIHLLALYTILATGVGSYFYINNVTNTREYANLVRDAQTIAGLIDPARVETLTLSEADLTNIDYIRLKEQVTNAKNANPDFRFVYLMAKRDESIYFMVDSEDPASEDYSPPGQEYDEASPELFAGWDDGAEPVLEIYEDRWGNWISALAPIRNASGTIALVGIDQNADAHRNLFLMQVGLATLATIALLSLVSMSYILSRREQDLIDMKADFVAVASHELRTPLMSLRWELAQLKTDTSIGPAVRSSISTMYTQICTLIDLSTSFLMTTSADHGMMSTTNFKPFDAAALVRSRIANATPLAANRAIAIETNVTPGVRAMVQGDEDRLRLVFDNLISNAIKYSPANSKIIITYTDNGTMKQFAVSDSGMGIPPKEISSIFGGFNRATNAKQAGVAGTGFGLYISKRIIDFHGGTIACKSTEGKGTVFTVNLPGV